MTYVLLLVACLSGDPSASSGCRTERLALPGVGNATACHLAARLRLRDWLRDHDIATLTDARCEAVDARSAALAG